MIGAARFVYYDLRHLSHLRYFAEETKKSANLEQQSYPDNNPFQKPEVQNCPHISATFSIGFAAHVLFFNSLCADRGLEWTMAKGQG